MAAHTDMFSLETVLMPAMGTFIVFRRATSLESTLNEGTITASALRRAGRTSKKSALLFTLLMG